MRPGLSRTVELPGRNVFTVRSCSSLLQAKIIVCCRSVRVIPRTSTRCNRWQLVEFPEQMCCFDIEPHPLRLDEGALLVDQGFLTAIKQFDTYLQSHLSTTVALFVRISFFMPWIQDVVLDPVPSKVYLYTLCVEPSI